MTHHQALYWHIEQHKKTLYLYLWPFLLVWAKNAPKIHISVHIFPFQWQIFTFAAKIAPKKHVSVRIYSFQWQIHLVNGTILVYSQRVDSVDHFLCIYGHFYLLGLQMPPKYTFLSISTSRSGLCGSFPVWFLTVITVFTGISIFGGERCRLGETFW